MRVAPLLAALLAVAASATADPRPTALDRCLSCHEGPDGAIDIVGLSALEGLPFEWQIVHEDAFDLDGDGVAGAVRFVSGGGHPLPARYGRTLAAGRFEDFALIAGAAHGIDVSDPALLAEITSAFLARSPDPGPPPSADALARFEARGCATCHVTESYEHGGRRYAPLSDYLLHDLGDGPVRTAPLWGCPSCLEAEGHPGLPDSAARIAVE